MIDRLLRLLGRGSLARDLTDRVGETERDVEKVRARVTVVEEKIAVRASGGQRGPAT